MDPKFSRRSTVSCIFSLLSKVSSSIPEPEIDHTMNYAARRRSLDCSRNCANMSNGLLSGMKLKEAMLLLLNNGCVYWYGSCR